MKDDRVYLSHILRCIARIEGGADALSLEMVFRHSATGLRPFVSEHESRPHRQLLRPFDD